MGRRKGSEPRLGMMRKVLVSRARNEREENIRVSNEAYKL